MNKNLFNLFWIQFLGALNDNLFKNALVIMIAYQGVSLFGFSSKILVPLCGAVFILPFLLFSALAGECSLKYDRVYLIRVIKNLEIGIMFFAALGFYLSNYTLLLVVLFLLGIHSTFFGPIKYSLIPKYAPDEKIVWANALISAGTFIAILLGTIFGGLLALNATNVWPLKFILLILSGVGIFYAYKLPLLNEGDESITIDYDFIRSTKKILRMITSDKEVYSLLFGLSWFWFLGAAILSLLPIIARDVFKAEESVATFMLFIFTLGMGLGPFVLEKLLKGKIVKVLIPISLFVMSLFLFDIAFVIRQFVNGNFLPNIFESISFKEFFNLKFSYRMTFDLFWISFFGGVFTVIQFSGLQTLLDSSSLSRVIAGNNIINALFMVSSSVLLMILHSFGFELFLILGIIGFLNFIAMIILIFLHHDEFSEYWRFD